MKTTPLMTLGVLLGCCWIAAAQDAPTKLPNHPFGMPTAELLKAFDKDGDGKLSAVELQAMRAARAAKIKEHRKAMLAKYDKDGDGKLSADEFKTMQQDRAAKRAQMEAHRKAMLAKHDTDGDGKLSDAERAAIPKDKHRGKHRTSKPPAATE